MLNSPYGLIINLCILAVFLYVFALLFNVIHEITIRLYILIKLDKKYKLTIQWEACLYPIVNIIMVYAALEYLLECVRNKENYIRNTAIQYYENDL